MEMPDEREITKQQLWGRIDTAIETINTIARNFSDNVSNILPTMNARINEAMALFPAKFTELCDDLREHVEIKIKFLEQVNNNSYGKFNDAGMRYQKEIDERLQKFRVDMENRLNEKIGEEFDKISVAISTLHKSVELYRAITQEQVSSLQIEMGRKLGEVMNNFTDMKFKFKKISDQLQ